MGNFTKEHNPIVFIPPKPIIQPEAAAYPNIRKIKTMLGKQDETIFEAECE